MHFKLIVAFVEDRKTDAVMEAAREAGATSVWVAVPVAAPESVGEIRLWADEVIAVHQPRRFLAVGAWYRDFTQVSDSEVRDLLDARR